MKSASVCNRKERIKGLLNLERKGKRRKIAEEERESIIEDSKRGERVQSQSLYLCGPN